MVGLVTSKACHLRVIKNYSNLSKSCEGTTQVLRSSFPTHTVALAITSSPSGWLGDAVYTSSALGSMDIRTAQVALLPPFR